MVFWNQLKNKISPFSSCFNTSVAMLLSDFGINKTPDQVLLELRGNKYTKAGKRIYPRIWHLWATRRRMLWELEAYYINQQFKENNIDYTAIFSSGYSVEINPDITEHHPIIIGTHPTYHGRKLGHIMVVGSVVEVGGKLMFWINDPFGDPTNNYTTQDSGYLVYITEVYFKELYAGNCIYIKQGEIK